MSDTKIDPTLQDRISTLQKQLDTHQRVSSFLTGASLLVTGSAALTAIPALSGALAVGAGAAFVTGAYNFYRAKVDENQIHLLGGSPGTTDTKSITIETTKQP